MPCFPFKCIGTNRLISDVVQPDEAPPEPAVATLPTTESDAPRRQQESRSARLRLRHRADRLWPDRRDHDGNTALHRALLSGDVHEATRQLRNGGDPNLAMANDGPTPLLAMATMNDEAGLPMIDVLLNDQRTNPNLGYVLYHAAQARHARVVARLLADPRTDPAATPTRFTTQDRALQDANGPILRAFHHAGYDLNKPGPDGRLPLHRALILRQPEQVQALIAAGADINLPDNEGRTALHFAGADALHAPPLPQPQPQPPAAIADALVQNPHRDDDPELEEAAPQRGIERGTVVSPEELQQRVLQFRLKNDQAIIDALFNVADKHIDAIDQQGNTPLHSAISACNIALIDRLIAAGADIAIANEDGDTALHLAAQGATAGLLPTLIAAGADVQRTNHRGETALDIVLGHYVVTASDATALIAAGATIHPASAATLAAFHRAIAFGNHDALAVLIAAGVDVKSADINGHVAIDRALAARPANTQVIQQLIAAGAVIDPAKQSSMQALYRFAQEGNVEVVGLLVQAGVDINHPSPLGSTALELAFQFPQPDMALARLLLRAGAQIRTFRSLTVDALVHAAAMDHVDIVQALLSAGTNINATDAQGRTALQLAARGGCHETLRRLLSDPALDVTAQFEGKTAFEWALTNGHSEAAVMLFNHPDTDPNVALVWAQEQPDIKALLLHRAGIDALDGLDSQIRLLTFCADHRPRIGQAHLDMLADTNHLLGTLLAQSPSSSASRDAALSRLTLAFEQQLRAAGGYRLPLHQQIASALLDTDPVATNFVIGQALIPRSEIEDMAKSEVYYAQREANPLLEQDLRDIVEHSVTANVHQPGLARLEIDALELLQRRDSTRLPRMTLEEATSAALALIAPDASLLDATERIATELQKLEPGNPDRRTKADFATKEHIRLWISQQVTESRDTLSAAWQHCLARYGLDHALAQIEAVNENGLVIATQEVIRLLMADLPSRFELQDNLRAAFIVRLIDVGGDPNPCNVGCVGRLLTTQFRVVPELMDGAPDPKTLKPEFNDIAMRVRDHVDAQLEQTQGDEHKENDIAALHDNAAAIKHDRFARTAEMLLLLRGLPPDSVQEHIAAIKDGFKQEMY